MAETVGGIIYEVGIDTSQLAAGSRELQSMLNGLSGNMGRLEASVNRTERSIGSMERTMSSLSGVAKGLFAALSVQQVASYADAWTELNNKVANSVRTGETQTEVMQRIFDVSQATQSSLNGTATLYARLERGTRAYNTSAEDLVRLTTIINQGFAVSGATAQEAENAIIQLSQGIASGVLRGEEFNSVSEQGSRLMVALADSMGVSIGQLRAMAAQGQLTTDVVVKGLLSQGDAIGKEFANTTVSIAKGLQVAGNNVTKFFGENSTVKSFAAGFRDSVITISENLETLSGALIIVAGIMGSRYVGALAMSTAAKISDIAASRQQLIAENQQAQSALFAANATQRKAFADKEAALSSVALAQAEYNVAKGSAAEALALDALIAAKSRARAASLSLAQAENAQAAASARAASAARAASVGVGLARGALSLIGGPAGAATLAAGAIFYFWQKAQQAREESIRFADSLDQVNESMKAMNNTQLRGVIADANKSIQAQEEYVRDLEDSIDKLKGEIDDYTARGKLFGTTIEQGNGLLKIASDKTDELNQKSRDLANAKEKLARTQEAASEARRTLTNNMLTSMGVHDSLIEKGSTLERVQGAVARAFGLTADEINRANQAGQNFNPKSLQVSPPTEEADKIILNLEEQNQLLKIQDERQRAVTKARMEAAKVTDNPNQIARAAELAGQIYDLTEAEKAREKAQNDSQSAAQKAATEQENIANKLEQLRQESLLTADSTRELSREQAILQAQQSLGKGATEEQIRLAGEYKAKAWDNANAIKAQAEAEKQRVEAVKGFAALKSQTSPMFAVETNYQKDLAALNAYAVAYPQKIAEVEQARAAIEEQYRQQRLDAMWQEWSQQNAATQAAAAAFDAFGQTASNALTGILTGSMSVSEALQSIGSTVLNAVINSFVQMGVEWLKSVIMGQAGMAAASAATAAQAAGIAAAMAPAAAMTSLATSGANAIPAQAGIASTVGVAKAMSVAGALKNGGPAQAGSMYRVGENNLPEIFQASNGHQYMIPGDSGRVISNKDLTGSGGGIVINNNVINNSSGATASSTARDNGDGSVTIETIVADIEAGGPISNAITSHTTATRRATE
ncbi:tail length tape measure protein [Klebsiella phage BUCT541]|jgi:tape measure domain-containing protein|uniref:tail length tape measure protein n=2 Tax=root TaxID=1 RepID=UPI001E6C765D|nr:tail length tape measure protein [Klebsiella phage BUCT541]MCJ3315851.1 tape measure protein [Klebsiella pneumoniae]UAW06838.1 tail length tape-measure protein 1 [Klebsiella phage BUCT541]